MKCECERLCVFTSEDFTGFRDNQDFPGDARFLWIFLSSLEQPRVFKTRLTLGAFQSWCATHSVCRRQVWAVATRVSHATCADPFPCLPCSCLPRTPWWSCPKNTHTPPHFTTYYSITLILTLLLITLRLRPLGG